MANIHSQKKRILRAERERIENRLYTSTIKTYFRRLREAVGSGDGEAAEREHRVLVSTIDKAVKRGALHRNTGARKKSTRMRAANGPSSARSVASVPRARAAALACLALVNPTRSLSPPPPPPPKIS